MFSNGKQLTDFIQQAFPQLKTKIKFSVILNQNKENSRSAVLFCAASITQEEQEQIKDVIKVISDISEIIIQIIGQIPLTDLEVLRSIKSFQPVDYNPLYEQLKSKNIKFEDADLRRMLDKLRKANLITRSQNRFYTVTESALGMIPHGNYRNSSDIQRLLELGKRKW